MAVVRLSSTEVSAEVSSEVSTTAGMLLDASFHFDRDIHPLARAPWIESGAPGHVGHLRVLGGEFVGVPFGSAAAPIYLARQWRSLVPTAPPQPAHGRSADAEWSIVESGPEHVVLVLDYPSDDAISRLVRTIRLRPGAHAIDFELSITCRRDARVPVGLHPILRLPQRAGELELEVGFIQGHTYPGTIGAGSMVTMPSSTFESLGAVPSAHGGTVYLSRLPLDVPVEDVVLLAHTTGVLTATNRRERHVTTLRWDAALLPSLLIWISDRAIMDAPWLGTYRGLGVEPIASAFDLHGRYRPPPIHCPHAALQPRSRSRRRIPL